MFGRFASGSGECAECGDEPTALLGHHSIDFTAKTVTRRTDAPREAAPEIHLTRTEWAILEVLVRNPGRLRFHLARLRQKVEPEPSRPPQLITETGMGYRYQP